MGRGGIAGVSAIGEWSAGQDRLRYPPEVFRRYLRTAKRFLIGTAITRPWLVFGIHPRREGAACAVAVCHQNF